jgi:hypothetical protein
VKKKMFKPDKGKENRMGKNWLKSGQTALCVRWTINSEIEDRRRRRMKKGIMKVEEEKERKRERKNRGG